MDSFNVFEWDLFCQPHKISRLFGLFSVKWQFFSHISMLK